MRDLVRLCNAVEAMNISIQIGFGTLIVLIMVIWVRQIGRDNVNE